jgi:RNA polymerase sigma-70 factor, ECF subfamily
LDDKHNVIKAKGGCVDSFVDLIEARKGKIYKIAYSYVKNQQDALDILQDATYKAFISIKTLKDSKIFDSWLTRIVVNCAIDFLRKRKKMLYVDDTSQLIQENSTCKSNIESELDLYTALDVLDEKHKTVIILRFFEDYTIKEIAAILDWPLNTVKTYLYRALGLLKIELKEGENYVN